MTHPPRAATHHSACCLCGIVTLSTTTTLGTLNPGRYLVTITYVAPGGEESAAPEAALVELEAQGSIILSNIPQSGAAGIKIYVSDTDGEVLRELFQVPMGTTQASITQRGMGKVLATHLQQDLPGGQIIRHYRGRLYVANGSTLWVSDSFRFGVCDAAKSFFQFPEQITVLEPVETGLYVGSDKIYFLSGDSPEGMKQVVASPIPAIFGTGVLVQGSYFDDNIRGEVAYWLTENGAVIGTPQGITVHLNEKHIAIPSYVEGASFVREQNGMRHVVTAVRGSGASSNLSFGDSVVTTVRNRNDITV